MNIQVEKNIPIYTNPVRTNTREWNYKFPWKTLEINDSFAVPCETITDVRRAVESLSSNMNYQNKKTGRMYAIRYCAKEVRVWRIA